MLGHCAIKYDGANASGKENIILFKGLVCPEKEVYMEERKAQPTKSHYTKSDFSLLLYKLIFSSKKIEVNMTAHGLKK